MPGGFADSPIRLNRELARLDTWNEEQIRRRAQRLANLSCVVWPYPQLSPEVLSVYRRETLGRRSTYQLTDVPSLEGKTRELFDQLRDRVMLLGPLVTEEVKARYIKYGDPSAFMAVLPQVDKLRLHLKVPVNELNDPSARAEDIPDRMQWGRYKAAVYVTSEAELEYAMHLIRQAQQKQHR
jgi:predicted transport protein